VSSIRIRIQQDDFHLDTEYQCLRQENPQAGAIVTFTGLVRDFNAEGGVSGIILEHYPGMTEKTLHRIAQQACERWSLAAVTILHRIGKLQGAEQIVLVATVSLHRHAAFAAAEFIMDCLKTEAPFWKREATANGERWVDAKDTDQRARERW
jgi:molybdopterin synthase catalytic subunit